MAKSLLSDPRSKEDRDLDKRIRQERELLRKRAQSQGVKSLEGVYTDSKGRLKSLSEDD